jgi:methionyl aminopeptidase
MIIKKDEDRKNIRKACKISMNILHKLGMSISCAKSSADIDRLASELCEKKNVKPAFYGVKSAAGKLFNYYCCTSINDEVVHGTATNDKKIKEGDIIKIDFGIKYKGFLTDHCFTFCKGELSPRKRKLVQTARNATENAVRHTTTGNTTGDLGSIMQNTALGQDFDVLKEYIGHGIGHTLHERPEIPAWGQPGSGTELIKGMLICIECQVVEGSDQVFTERDGWTVKTSDGGLSAMFEYMVIVDNDNPEVLTPMWDWNVEVK